MSPPSEESMRAMGVDLVNRAQFVHTAAERAALALERVTYDCRAAVRDRERLAQLGTRAHAVADVLEELGTRLLVLAARSSY